MNFENLKGLLGDAYHDDITAEEINNFFPGLWFFSITNTSLFWCFALIAANKPLGPLPIIKVNITRNIINKIKGR